MVDFHSDAGMTKTRQLLPLLFFVLGLLLMIVALARPQDAQRLMPLVEISWALAYFTLLRRNDRKKTPISTRGGVVRYEVNPIGYRIAYGFLYFFGTALLLVALAVTLFSE
jgi:hypothetical protein